MIPFKPNRRYAVPQTLEKRLEIVRGIRTLFEQYDVTKASPDDPQHPGWPAGSPDSKGGEFRPKDGSANITTAALSRMSEAEREAQDEKDLAICRRARLDACYGQAMARYSACTSGHQIPPLNF